MFFYLSKIFWFLIQPINLAIFLLAIGIAFRLFGVRRPLRPLAFLSFLVLVLCSWTSFGAMLLTPLEERFSRPAELPARIDGIVVLGGGLEGAVNLARGGYELNSGGDRYVETAILALRHPEARVVVTGGSGALVLDGEGDGETAPRLLNALGIGQERLILENESRNTYENAVFTKRMVAPAPGETWLLVTSAFHMPRSIALFEKAGFPVLPWPVDYRTSGREGIGFFRDNPVDSMQAATMAIREWIGLWAYYLSGRIDSPFPGPGK
jgi:uncharacterized SAM-binding protein YcdF (DUF218 family)